MLRGVTLLSGGWHQRGSGCRSQCQPSSFGVSGSRKASALSERVKHNSKVMPLTTVMPSSRAGKFSISFNFPGYFPLVEDGSDIY